MSDDRKKHEGDEPLNEHPTEAINMDAFSKSAVGSLFDEPPKRESRAHKISDILREGEPEPRRMPSRERVTRPKTQDEEDKEYNEYIEKQRVAAVVDEVRKEQARNQARAEIESKLAVSRKPQNKKPPQGYSQRVRYGQPQRRAVQESDVNRYPRQSRAQSPVISLRHISAAAIAIVLVVFVVLVFQINRANASIVRLEEELLAYIGVTQQLSLYQLENAQLRAELAALTAQPEAITPPAGQYETADDPTDTEDPTTGSGPYTGQGGNPQHVVQAGETLRLIASNRLGDPNRYTEIMAANNITNPNHIEVGDVLTIPTD